MNDWLIYTRHCPRCQAGLCRVRVCNATESPIYFLLCDECEATWTCPREMHIYPQADAANAMCPETNTPVWSAQTHWASLLETIEAGWYGHVYVERDRTGNN